VPLQPLLQ
jgi:hypothetical protein